jgi:3-hydroxybutyryl-CoA dehydrogenase
MTIRHCFLAGAGLMGHGIAQVLATAGRTVDLYEPDLARAEAGRARIAGNLDRAVAKGRLDATAGREILDRIAATDRLAAAAEADLVVEAIFEDEAAKRALWADLDGLAPGRAIFASNTSSISIDRLAEALAPGRRPAFCGMHFFSPVPVMPLVELIRGSATDEATTDAVRALAGDLGKQVIVSADRPGFIVNRILMPLLAEAMRALEEGIGTAEDIDSGARVGLNHPMGPLALADFIGLDVVLGIMRVLHADLGDERFRPPRVLEELVAGGKLGHKTGAGFFAYPRA